jgi:hypothetical protein
VDFKTLQGLSHYDNTSTIPGATLEKRQKAVNKEYHDRTRKHDSELHGSQQDQRGPIESELNEYGHSGRVLAPEVTKKHNRKFGPFGKFSANSGYSPIPPRFFSSLANSHNQIYPHTNNRAVFVTVRVRVRHDAAR